VKLVRYGSIDSLTIDLGMAKVEFKKEKEDGAFSVVRAETWQDGNNKVEVRVKPTTYQSPTFHIEYCIIHMHVCRIKS
jgi:hypothetical protein